MIRPEGLSRNRFSAREKDKLIFTDWPRFSGFTTFLKWLYLAVEMDSFPTLERRRRDNEYDGARLKRISMRNASVGQTGVLADN